MVNSVSIRVPWTGEISLTNPVRHPDLGAGKEHIALLVDRGRFELLRRKLDLLDEGVAAVFHLASGEAGLLAFSSHAGTFTSARARTWLADRGFTALLLVPNAGTLAADDCAAPLAGSGCGGVSGNPERSMAMDDTDILIVDDDQDTCASMSDIFVDLGYTVDGANDGPGALELSGRQQYRVALLDFNMPGMDGLQLCRHLKKAQPAIVVALITAFASIAKSTAAAEAGVRCSLLKPVNFSVLMPLVEAAVGRN